MAEKAMALEEILFPGTPIQIGNKTYVMPSLSLNGLIKAKPLFEGLDFQNIDEVTLTKMAELAHLGFARNYPELTVEVLMDLIDLSNIKEILETVVQVNGLQNTSKDPNVPASSKSKK